MQKLFLFFLLLVFAGIALPGADLGDNVLYQAEFKDAVLADSPWRWYNISADVVESLLRVRESGEKSSGSFQNYVPFDLRQNSEYRYLQVQAGAVEFTEMGGYATNTSTGGRSLGPVFPGWNTYDFYSQPALAGQKGNFSLAFVQAGKPGLQPGGWADYRLYRVVKQPSGGLTIRLFRAGKEFSGPGQVGDDLRITYYSAGNVLEKELEISWIAYPLMAEYRFSAEPIRLKESSPGIFTAEVRISEEAIKLDTIAEKQQLVACAKIHGELSYGTLAAPLQIEGKAHFGYEGQARGTHQTIHYRKIWMEATRGNNLALGKKVFFSREPDYPLTRKGDTDTEDLTDGKLSLNQQDKIWFDQQAVGWLNGAADGVNILLDLGEVKALDKVVLRCLGGAGGNLSFPRRLQLFLSRDGRDFYPAANLEKLMQGERAQSDFRHYYYLVEENNAYVYPFTLNAQAEARYIGLCLYGTSDFLFCDELAVIEAAPAASDAQFNQAYQQEPQPFHTSGIVFAPRINRLGLASNAILPNRFFIQDMRTEAEAERPVALYLELPEGFELLNGLACEKGAGKNRYLLQQQEKGRLKTSTDSFFIRCTQDFSPVAKDTAPLQASFYAEVEGLERITRTVPISVVELPALPVFRRLHVSLSWMVEHAALAWPDFYQNWGKLGFNAISLFPRYWGNGPNQKVQEWMRQGRELGYKLIMNESPFHPMVKGQAPGSEVYSQLPAGNGKNLCPSYRGALFQKEMQRIYQNVLRSRPDFVFWDIECWYNGAAEATACTRCSEAWKKSGRPLDEYLKSLGKELNQALYDQVALAAKEGAFPMPVVASYDRHAADPHYALLEDFFADYPRTLKLAQPSLYVGGRAEDVHDAIRAEYRLLKNRDILPWLSPGCYGEFEPEKMEAMVLEALLNGACGITYYGYGEFDNALDFYYHCKALAKIAPYEDLLLDGQVLEPNGSNPELFYSGIQKGEQALLLVGNYRRAAESCTLSSPLQTTRRIVDAENGQTLPGLTIEVPKGGFRLLYLEGTP